ncbi:MAG: T9SS type A sorting domain-containing protein [Lewinellaceae bacterium]|nr:T9SS type A sorting domain-containing protein [Lewinellaceae bacterium]
MKRILTLLILLSFVGFRQANAQLADGSIAPDFVGTDINGNTWHLYDLLDQGIDVILDVSATWCAPCWNYHNTHALEDLYAQYGPNGTNEFMVLFIEGDPTTNMDDLEGLTAESQGNWIAGTEYPIIDAAEIADLYEITYFPTIFHICPNRIVTEPGQITTAEHYATKSECTPAFGANNGGLLFYTGFKGSFCQTKTFSPAAKLQNLGTDTIKSATIVLTVNGEVTETKEWSGALSKFQITDVTFGEMTVEANTEIVISIQSINGMADEDTSNDMLTANIERSVIIDTTALNLVLATDQYAVETYWELLDGTGNAVYTGGNQGIFTNQVHPDSYAGNTAYNFDLPVPKDGCYEFRVYDAYGDGMCCNYGQGGYQMTDGNGTVLAAGGSFGDQVSHLFELSGAEPLVDNAQIVVYSGERGEFCHSVSYAPSIAFQNIGSNDITSADFEISQDGQVVQTYNWTGTLTPLDFTLVSLDEVTFNADGAISFKLVNVNGQPDDKTYKNEYQVSFNRQPVTVYDTLTLNLKTDQYGIETFWYLADDQGDIVASGGNPNVGPDGGGQSASPGSSPQAYGANRSYTIEIPVPANGCYQFVMVDSYGDGMCCNYGQGFFSLEDPNGEVLASGGQYGAYDRSGLEVDKPVATTDLDELQGVELFPNPVSASLNIGFNLDKALPLEIGIVNTLGQRVSTVQAGQFAAGRHQISMDVRNLANGIYFLTVRSADRLESFRFVVNR